MASFGIQCVLLLLIPFSLNYLPNALPTRTLRTRTTTTTSEEEQESLPGTQSALVVVLDWFIRLRCYWIYRLFINRAVGQRTPPAEWRGTSVVSSSTQLQIARCQIATPNWAGRVVPRGSLNYDFYGERGINGTWTWTRSKRSPLVACHLTTRWVAIPFTWDVPVIKCPGQGEDGRGIAGRSPNEITQTGFVVAKGQSLGPIRVQLLWWPEEELQLQQCHWAIVHLTNVRFELPKWMANVFRSRFPFEF